MDVVNIIPGHIICKIIIIKKKISQDGILRLLALNATINKSKKSIYQRLT